MTLEAQRAIPPSDMDGAELRAIRLELDLDLASFGRALGYAGERDTMRGHISGLEAGRRPIPPWIARLAFMYGKHGIPKRYAADIKTHGRIRKYADEKDWKD